MLHAGRRSVRTAAHLVDPEDMTVLWMNEPAVASMEPDKAATPGMPVSQALPEPEASIIPGALRLVADTGETHHVHATLVSVARGSISATSSIYRLPDGSLLLLTERTFHATGRPEPS
jgi:hypothetical protein